MLGIADTGVDMDNCQFWESANNPSFPQRGLGPLDNGRVDMSRRKVATYEGPPASHESIDPVLSFACPKFPVTAYMFVFTSTMIPHVPFMSAYSCPC